MDVKVLGYSTLMLVGVFIASVSQVLLKKEAMTKHQTVVEEYLNIRVILAYALFLLTTFATMYAYKYIPLSLGPILEATSYIYITLFGVMLFNEKISLEKILALGFILAGIGVYALFA